VGTGVKRQGREADRSPPSSAEVKDGGAVPPFPHKSPWHDAGVIKCREIFGSFRVHKNYLNEVDAPPVASAKHLTLLIQV
jgi:hypothetical protein